MIAISLEIEIQCHDVNIYIGLGGDSGFGNCGDQIDRILGDVASTLESILKGYFKDRESRQNDTGIESSKSKMGKQKSTVSLFTGTMEKGQSKRKLK